MCEVKSDNSLKRLDKVLVEKIAIDISLALKRKGYNAFMEVGNNKINIKDVRLSDDFISKFGRNINDNGRRGNYLGWSNWRVVNETINDILNFNKIHCKVSSQGNKITIREGLHGLSINELISTFGKQYGESESLRRWFLGLMEKWRSEDGYSYIEIKDVRFDYYVR